MQYSPTTRPYTLISNVIGGNKGASSERPNATKGAQAILKIILSKGTFPPRAQYSEIARFIPYPATNWSFLKPLRLAVICSRRARGEVFSSESAAVCRLLPAGNRANDPFMTRDQHNSLQGAMGRFAFFYRHATHSLIVPDSQFLPVIRNFC